MKIHFVLEPASAEELLEVGRLAENYGFEHVWLPNHAAARDPFMALSVLARESSTIRMGPVAISPFELHPLKMANQLFTLNEMSHGRAGIVVGGGGGTTIAMHLKSDRYVTHARMVRGVRECVEFLKSAAPDAALDFDGEIFQVDRYRPSWARDDRPPVYVGATKPQMLRMSAQVADGVMFSDLTVGRLNESMQILNGALAGAGRAESGFRVNNLFSWHVKRDREEAMAEARRKLWVRGMLDHWYISPALNERDCKFVAENMQSFIKAYINDSPAIDGVPDELVELLVDELTFTGDLTDVDKLIERFHVFRNAGVTELSLRLYDDPAYSITVIGETVGPELG